MRNWLVISDCQTFGLKNCLSLLNPKMTVDWYDVHQLQTNGEAITKELHKYDRVFVNDQIYLDNK